ncbi:MAG: alpha/beta hydrolase [Marinosulfonomonas sp.]
MQMAAVGVVEGNLTTEKGVFGRRKALRALMCLFFLGTLAACSPAPDLIGVDNPNVPVESVSQAKKHMVFLATTREASEAVGAFYSAERAPELGLASVVVSVPPTHVVGELERPKQLPPDPTKEFAVIDPTVYATEKAFVASVNRELAKRPRGQRNILVFVHGYNNTTSDAILRLGQFVEDTGFQGVPVLFDWASAAKISRYVYDMNSALIARPKVQDLRWILSRTHAEKYDVFAHSMGAFLIMEAMRDQAQSGQLDPEGKLNGVVLASPDIDIDLFRSQMADVDTKFDRFFVLLSKDDEALKFSRRIAGGVDRVGAADADELARLGVIAIDLSDIEDSSSGTHSKFAGSPEVVKFIGEGMNRSRIFNRSSISTELNDMLSGVPIRVAFE